MTWLFLLYWLVFYFLVLLVMSLDNINWIRSSEEWKYPFGIHKEAISETRFKEYLKYVFLFRIKTVFTDVRDIIPAIISSFCLTLAFYNYFVSSIIVLIIGLLLSIIGVRYWRTKK